MRNGNASQSVPVNILELVDVISTGNNISMLSCSCNHNSDLQYIGSKREQDNNNNARAGYKPRCWQKSADEMFFKNEVDPFHYHFLGDGADLALSEKVMSTMTHLMMMIRHSPYLFDKLSGLSDDVGSSEAHNASHLHGVPARPDGNTKTTSGPQQSAVNHSAITDFTSSKGFKANLIK